MRTRGRKAVPPPAPPRSLSPRKRRPASGMSAHPRHPAGIGPLSQYLSSVCLSCWARHSAWQHAAWAGRTAAWVALAPKYDWPAVAALFGACQALGKREVVAALAGIDPRESEVPMSRSTSRKGASDEVPDDIRQRVLQDFGPERAAEVYRYLL